MKFLKSRFNTNTFLVGIILVSVFLHALSIQYFLKRLSSNLEQHSSKTNTITPTASEEPRWVVPVVSVAYYPLADGKLDTTTAIQDKYGEYNLTYSQVATKVDGLITQTETALEAGQQVIDYQIIDHQEKLIAVPLTEQTYNDLPLPDYQQMMLELDICSYVENQGIKEVWLWTYGGVGKAGWESNFSNSLLDISNSNRDQTDLPICKKPYTVYDYNYGRSVNEAVHNHMHQFEAIFGHLDARLFWEKFVGMENQIKGCGNTHFPPNATQDYQYASSSAVHTTCGVSQNNPPQPITCQAWNCSELDYYIWWMNQVPSDWWEYVAEPESLFSRKAKLVL